MPAPSPGVPSDINVVLYGQSQETGLPEGDRSSR